MTDRPRVLLGMSGGVDSTASALLLLEQGYDVTGVTLQLFSRTEGCAAQKDCDDAAAAAKKLGIPHRVVDFSAQFRDTVQQNFISEYLCARTPNPCIICNREIKFGAMAQLAAAEGFDFVATGHYAQITCDDGVYHLRRGKDLNKDQSYVLYFLSQDQLRQIHFPLGGLTKAEVREIAAAAGLANAEKQESQDICFVPDGDYAGFIQRTAGAVPPPGNFISPDGEILGEHRGLIHYTVGQRRGLGISFGSPRYVTAKNAAENTVTLAPNEHLFADVVSVTDCRWDSRIPDVPINAEVKLRYTQRDPQPAQITADGNCAVLQFDAPQRAVTPGQTAVFYQKDIVLGGGLIEKGERSVGGAEHKA
ncbi:MAG: tRNA 2-thiouridine(34) synthase MnmA [Ruminococcus sp.]|nr:tRNA 2-thiouridine(34) synthase MnmA [Ruminococcus sp.]